MSRTVNHHPIGPVAPEVPELPVIVDEPDNSKVVWETRYHALARSVVHGTPLYGILFKGHRTILWFGADKAHALKAFEAIAGAKVAALVNMEREAA